MFVKDFHPSDCRFLLAFLAGLRATQYVVLTRSVGIVALCHGILSVPICRRPRPTARLCLAYRAFQPLTLVEKKADSR